MSIAKSVGYNLACQRTKIFTKNILSQVRPTTKQNKASVSLTKAVLKNQ